MVDVSSFNAASNMMVRMISSKKQRTLQIIGCVEMNT